MYACIFMYIAFITVVTDMVYCLPPVANNQACIMRAYRGSQWWLFISTSIILLLKLTLVELGWPKCPCSILTCSKRVYWKIVPLCIFENQYKCYRKHYFHSYPVQTITLTLKSVHSHKLWSDIVCEKRSVGQKSCGGKT